VVFIVSDGLRWQEVFNGAEQALLEDEDLNWTPQERLRKAYWNDDPKERRKRLLPFLWGTVAEQGQVVGNPELGSAVSVLNPHWFSYPGYNEMASGVVDSRIDTNEFGPNPNVTVYEWLNRQPALAGKIEVFATWGAFHDIFNGQRAGLGIRAGETIVDPADHTPEGQMFAELYRSTPHLEDEDPQDAFVHIALRRHLEKSHPRVLFVGYGDTDNYAHAGLYDQTLAAAQRVDGFIARLWQQMQSLPQYRDRTTFIITTDHGRGSGPVDWKEHGTEWPGSEDIWIAVIGPDTPALGERRNVPAVTQAQVAATIAALLGRDYRAASPKAGAPLPDVIAPAAPAQRARVP
jgi:hypothetical protein